MRQIFLPLMIAGLLLVVISCTGGGNVVSPVTEPEMTLGTSYHTGQSQTLLFEKNAPTSCRRLHLLRPSFTFF